MRKYILPLVVCCLQAFTSSAASYYSRASATPLDATNPANWTTSTNGVGGTSPTIDSFASTHGITWHAHTQGGLTTSVAWNLAGFLKVDSGLTISVAPSFASGLSITVSTGGTLTMNAGTTLTALTINTGGTAILSTGGVVTALASIQNSGVLNVASGTTLALGTSFVITGTGTYAGGGTIATLSPGTSSTPLPTGSTFSGTVQYAATSGSQKVVAGTYNNLSLSGSSVAYTLNGVIAVTGAFTNAGSTTTSYLLGGTPTSVSNSGTFITSVPSSTSTSPLPSGFSWGGTVQYSGSSQSVAGGTYNNLTISNTSTTNPDSARGSITVNGAFSNAGGIFDMGTGALAVNGSIANTGTIRTGNTSTSPLSAGISWPGSVSYAAGGQTVVAGTYATLVMGNTSGTNTASGTVSVTTKLTTTAGGIFDLGGNAITPSTISNSGTLMTSSTSSTALPTGQSWGGTVQFYGSGAQTVPTGTYNSLSVTGAGGAAAAGALSITTSLNIGSSATLNMAANKLTCGTTTTVSNSGILQTAVPTTTSTTPIPQGKNWAPGSVYYTLAGGGQTVSSGTYGNLYLQNSSASTGSDKANGSIVVTGSLNTTAGGTFDMGALSTLNVAAATLNLNGILMTEVTTGTSASPLTPGVSWGGEVQYAAAGYGQTVVQGTYNKLTIAGSGCLAGGNISVTTLLKTTTSSSYLNFGTSNVLTGSPSISNAGSIQTSVPSSTSTTPLPSGLSWSGGGIVNYAASTGGQTVVGGTYDNLTISNTTGTTNTVSGDITINTQLYYTTTGSLNLGINNISGSFTVFPGSAGQLQTQSTSANPLPANKLWNMVINYNNPTGGQSIAVGTYKSLYNSAGSGTNTLNGSIIVNNKLNLVSGILNDGGNTLTLNGQLTGTATHTGTGSIVMKGTDTTVSRLAGVTVGNLYLNRPAHYYLSGNLTVNGTLTLNSPLRVDSFNLVINNGGNIALASGDDSCLVMTTGSGVLQMYTPGSGSLLFPIGDTLYNYTPVTIAPTSGTYAPGASYFAVTSNDLKATNNANVSNFLNRYWTVTTTGITAPTYDLTSAQYVTADISGTESKLMTGALPVSIPWVRYDAANTSLHKLTATGISGTTNIITGVSNVSPTVSATATAATICSGGSTTLNVTASSGDPALSYSWAPSTGLSVTTGTSVVASPGSSQTYTVTVTDGNGLTNTATVAITVESAQTAGTITGNGTTCVAGTDALSDVSASAVGTWSSSSPLVATVNSSTGLVTGVANGSAVINFTISNSCGTFSTTFNEVVSSPASITGTSTVCVGAVTALANSVAGGTWSGSNGFGTVDGSGNVTGVAGGTLTVVYTMPVTGCAATQVVTVNALPTASFTSSPASSVCASSSVTYTTQSGESNYVWSVPGVLNTDYTVSAGGTGTSNSTVTLQWLTSGSKAVTVNYTDANGCTSASSASNSTTVNSLPTASFTSGAAASVCASSSVTYTTQSGEGSYSWSVPGVLNTDYTISSGGTGSASNTVTLQWLTAGSKTVTVNYIDANGCTSASAASNATNVNALPVAGFTASPSSTICEGTTVTYTTQSGESSYIWSVPGVLNTDYTVSSGGTGGSNSTVTLQWLTTGGKTVTVNYTDANGCTSAAVANSATTVVSLPVSTFTSAPGSTICASTATTYTTQSGQSNYIWNVSGVLNTDYTITSGGTGTASNTVTLNWLTAGAQTVTVNYNNANSCTSASAASSTTTVNALPVASFTASPASSVCASNNVTYTTQAGQSSYSWSVPGTLNTDYTISAGGTGSASNTVTLQWLTSGAKTVTVNYNNSNGCASASPASSATTVNALPSVSFTSPSASTSCVSSNVVYTTQAGQTNYVWNVPGVLNTDYTITSGSLSTSSNTATLNWLTSGSKTVTVNYANSSGCSALSAASNTITVNAVPTATFTASPGASICTSIGTTYTTQSGQSNYTWSVPGTAGTDYSISSGGTGTSNTTVTLQWLTTGTKTVTVNYANANGCTSLSAASIATSVLQTPNAIAGATSVCPTKTTTLTDATAGGTWSSAATATASVNATGVVTGVQAGSTTISYTSANGCFQTYSFLVKPTPTIVSATSTSICPGATSTMVDSLTGGVWNSSSTSIATISATGATAVITGVAAGTVLISYQYNSCLATKSLTVSAGSSIASIGGTAALCNQATSTLSDATAGGTWTSANPAVVTVGSSNGVLSGLTPGTSAITYTVGGCFVTATATVNGPVAISGASTVCLSNVGTLTDATSGGVWSSGTPGVATINSGGVISPVTTGTTTISYTKSSCSVVQAVTVITNNVAAIGGTSAICNTGGTGTATDATPSGTWSTTASAILTIGSTTGTITSVGIGSGVITYTGSSCYQIRQINVGAPIPAITGPTSVCTTSTVTMADSMPSGNWYSSATTKATVNTVTGVVTGVAAGTTIISYYKNGCLATTNLTVNSCARVGGNGASEAETEGFSYSVYPNPATSILNIEQNNTNSSVLPVLVLNYVGSTVFSGEIAMTSGKGTLDVSRLAPGVYLIVLRSPDGTQEKFKVVVQ